MSMQDRVSVSVFEKLKDMKQYLNDEHDEFSSFTQEEEEKLLLELLQQAQSEDESKEIDDRFFDDITGPSQDTGNEKLVEVEYMGRLGYVDISFENLEEDMSDMEYKEILSALEIMAYSDDINKRKEAIRKVEAFGEKSIVVIFRECRKFDLSEERKRVELVNLLARLTVRSFRGRKIIKAVLEKASSSQHVSLAILGAGTIREREAVDGILEHMKEPDFFSISFEALLKIRDQKTVEPIINNINNLDVSRNDLRDQAIHLAPRFGDFGPDAVKPVFEAYINCQKKPLRPIFTLALRSFKEDAIPVLAAVLEDETNEDKLVPICMTLGSLKMPFSTNLLKNTFEQFPNKRRAAIIGFSYTNDPSLVPILLKELKSTSDLKLKKECLKAIGHIVGEEKNVLNEIKPYLHEYRNKIYLDALYCVVRLGDKEGFDKFAELLVNGNDEEQFILQNFLARMPFKVIAKMAEKMLHYPDDKALLLVSALQKSNMMPREVGGILEKKLNQNPIPALKVEIYRLIGKHVNNHREILSQEILYKARREEEDPRIIRELDQIIDNMRKERGRVSTTRKEN